MQKSIRFQILHYEIPQMSSHYYRVALVQVRKIKNRFIVLRDFLKYCTMWLCQTKSVVRMLHINNQLIFSVAFNNAKETYSILTKMCLTKLLLLVRIIKWKIEIISLEQGSQNRLKVVVAENQIPSICDEIPKHSQVLMDFC